MQEPTCEIYFSYLISVGDTKERPTCKTCPYWDGSYDGSVDKPDRDQWHDGNWPHSACQRNERGVDKDSGDWCGQHPDFPEWYHTETHKILPSESMLTLDMKEFALGWNLTQAKKEADG